MVEGWLALRGFLWSVSADCVLFGISSLASRGLLSECLEGVELDEKLFGRLAR